MPNNVENEKHGWRDRLPGWLPSAKLRSLRAPSFHAPRMPKFMLKTCDRWDAWANQYPTLFGGPKYKVGNTWDVDPLEDVLDNDTPQIEAGQAIAVNTAVSALPGVHFSISTGNPAQLYGGHGQEDAPEPSGGPQPTQDSQAEQPTHNQRSSSRSIGTIHHSIHALTSNEATHLPPPPTLAPSTLPRAPPPPPPSAVPSASTPEETPASAPEDTPESIFEEGGQLTTFGAANTLTGETFGISMTVLPNAFATLGMGTGLVAFTLCYIQYIIASMWVWSVCMRYPGQIRSITDFAHVVCPRWARTVGVITFSVWFISLELIASAHILTVGSIFAGLMGHEGNSERSQHIFPWKVINGNLLATIIGYSMTSRRHIRKLNIAVMLASILVFVAILYCLGSLAHTWNTGLDDPMSEPPQVHWLWNPDTDWTDKMVALLKMHFAFFVQQNVPAIVNKMKHPENFPKALHLSGTFLYSTLTCHASISYVYVTEAGYKGVDPYIINNLKEPHSHVVGGLMSFPAMTQVSLLGSIFMDHVSNMLDESKHLNKSDFWRRHATWRAKIPSVIIVVFWVIAGLAGGYIPNIKTMMALVASTSGHWLIYFLPAQAMLMMLRVDKTLSRPKWRQKVWRWLGWPCMVLFFMGAILLATYGSYSAGRTFEQGLAQADKGHKNATHIIDHKNKTETEKSKDPEDSTKPTNLSRPDEVPDIDDTATGNLTSPFIDASDDDITLWTIEDMEDKNDAKKKNGDRDRDRKKDRKHDHDPEKHHVQEKDGDEGKYDDEDDEDRDLDTGRERGRGRAKKKYKGRKKDQSRGQHSKESEDDEEGEEDQERGEDEGSDSDYNDERGAAEDRTPYKSTEKKPPVAAGPKPKRSTPLMPPVVCPDGNCFKHSGTDEETEKEMRYVVQGTKVKRISTPLLNPVPFRGGERFQEPDKGNRVIIR